MPRRPANLLAIGTIEPRRSIVRCRREINDCRGVAKVALGGLLNDGEALRVERSSNCLVVVECPASRGVVRSQEATTEGKAFEGGLVGINGIEEIDLTDDGWTDHGIEVGRDGLVST